VVQELVCLLGLALRQPLLLQELLRVLLFR
jgi:hypothetical protein